MEKIPTLYRRNPTTHTCEDLKITPGCEWVRDGTATPTRKWDGTCVLVDTQQNIWTRRAMKNAATLPNNSDFKPVETDPKTGITVGWEPAHKSGFVKFIDEALTIDGIPAPGTYELVGPKINGNRDRLPRHRLVRHGSTVLLAVPIRAAIQIAHDSEWEGIVWWHPDGRRAKLKVRDFPGWWWQSGGAAEYIPTDPWEDRP